jgi:hypothetical protein
MSKRVELRQMYGRGWDTWDPDLLKASLADGFFFDDPAFPDRITVDSVAEYMAGWRERVKSLGGTGEITSRDRVRADVDGAFITWHWWGFAGTGYEGSAVTRTTDDGVQYERMTYYPTTPDFSK